MISYADKNRTGSTSRPIEPSKESEKHDDTFNRWARQCRIAIARHPEIAIAVAATVGFACGWFRRR